MVKQAIEECGVPEEKIFGIGVCLPGVVDSETGILRSHPGYAWERKNVAGDFAKCLGTKLNISVENNACARAYASQLFGGDILNGVSSFAYMFVSTGIACPIIFNCFQDYGVMIGAGEAGHMVMDPEGPICACGNRGCLEAYASDRAVIERCNDIMRMGEAPILKSLTGGKIPTMDAILQAQIDGEKSVDLIINTAVTNIAIATANIDNMARPDIIMFDAVMFENSVNRERFLKCVNQHLYTETHANTRFEFVAPNVFSGASGGAAIAIRADFESELD
jgi:predicted NBD/HSP70 family sugar kinase